MSLLSSLYRAWQVLPPGQAAVIGLAAAIGLLTLGSILTPASGQGRCNHNHHNEEN